jgi:hypothetical protein
LKKQTKIKNQVLAAKDLVFKHLISFVLALADSEHLGAAFWASTLCCGLAILHFDGFSITHFSLGAAFHTVSLHLVHLLFDR